MISRRDALKLGVVGFGSPSLSMASTQSPVDASAVQIDRTVIASTTMNAERVAKTGPSPDLPIIVKWKFSAEGATPLPPVIHNGIAYLACSAVGWESSFASHLIAVDASNGEEIWRSITNDVFIVSVEIVDDNIFVASVGMGSAETTNLVIQSLHAQSGNIMWSFDFTCQLDESISFTPVEMWPVSFVSLNVRNGLIVVAARGQGNIHALDQATGEVVWQHPEQFRLTDVVVHEHIVLAATVPEDGDRLFVHALSLTSGEELWSHSASGAGGIGAWRFSGLPLTVTETSLLIPGVTDNSLDMIDLQTGSQVWRYTSDSYLNVVASHEGLTFAASGSLNRVIDEHAEFTLHALDSDSGEEIWRHSGIGIWQASVGDTSIYTGGSLTALDLATGEERWRASEEYNWGNLEVHDGITLGFGAPWYGSANTSELGFLHVQVFNATTGEEKWANLIDGEQFLVSADQVMTERTDESLFMTFFSGRRVDPALLALSTESGELQWRFDGVGELMLSTVQEDAIFASVVSDDWTESTVYAIGNLTSPVLKEDVQLRAAPSQRGAERGSAKAGDEISNFGSRETQGEVTWIEVTIGEDTGWIPLDSIDPATLPPQGEIEYIYVPD